MSSESLILKTRRAMASAVLHQHYSGNGYQDHHFGCASSDRFGKTNPRSSSCYEAIWSSSGTGTVPLHNSHFLVNHDLCHDNFAADFCLIEFQVITKCSAPGQLALAYDDGPYQYTQKLVDTLTAGGAKGTFFVTGMKPRCKK
jgi:hypothetical protein